MFAVIKTGGKQYVVIPGQKLKVEKLEAEAGKPVVFDTVLLIADESVFKIGDPSIKGAVVKARAVRQFRTRKITVFKYHNKTRYRKKAGHRQHMTEVEIQDIVTQ
ncbi:MAG: 50S ribosomal protein L21 [Candidatus Sungbacteria bacterium]|nr:50S ribosomal protein L21 [bacterium]MDZ4260171.1 50S ribosomal protein L21 [Candidatus Sungbacteria bacterium]